MRSMTGHGSAVLRDGGLDIEVEIRTLNHRFFNLKNNLPQALGRHESEVEKIVRSKVSRGSVNVGVAIKSVSSNGPALPDSSTVKNVYKHLRKVQKDLKIPGEVTMEALLGLPHLWTSDSQENQTAQLWPRVRKLIEEAVEDLYRMRTREGKGIKKTFQSHLKKIEEVTGEIIKLSPKVMKAYEKKLVDRVNTLTKQHGMEVSSSDLVREVAIFADRSDISEELQRLQSHCKQFRKILDQEGQIGRKLDFLTQEMAREANTLAAKGGDSGLSALAVEVKSEIEKIKEQAENTE